MGHNHQQLPQLQMFRRWMVISLVITIVSLILLWSDRPDNILQFWTQYHRPTDPEPEADVPIQLPQQCGRGQIVARGQELSIVAANGTKTLLVSAYQEHRTGKREIRVIAVVLRKEAADYRCLLCCKDQLHISKGVSDIHSDHFDFAYGTADIMCPLPPGCESTSHITVISGATSEDELHEFIEVKNQKTGNGSFSYNFTVCLSTMFDFTNALQLVQSLEMLKLLGVNRVGIYLSSCSPEARRILNYYSQRGLVEVIPWSWSKYLNVSRGFVPSLDPGDLHYFGQIPALNDCVYRYMYQSRYVALHDIDELILPQSVSSWLELLPILEKKYGADKGYMFENNVFPNTVTKPPPSPQTLPPQISSWQNVSGVNILAHLYSEPIIAETHYTNFKTIVNPRAVFSPTVHGLLKSQSGCSWVDRNIARMYHTRPAKQTKLTPEQLVYDGRLLSYGDGLVPAVNTVLRESGLLPENI